MDMIFNRTRTFLHYCYQKRPSDNCDIVFTNIPTFDTIIHVQRQSSNQCALRVAWHIAIMLTSEQEWLNFPHYLAHAFQDNMEQYDYFIFGSEVKHRVMDFHCDFRNGGIHFHQTFLPQCTTMRISFISREDMRHSKFVTPKTEKRTCIDQFLSCFQLLLSKSRVRQSFLHKDIDLNRVGRKILSGQCHSVAIFQAICTAWNKASSTYIGSA